MEYPNKIYCRLWEHTPGGGVFSDIRFAMPNEAYIKASYIKEALINLYECMQESNREEHFKQRDTLGKLIGEL